MKTKWFTLGCLTSIAILIIIIFSTLFTFGNLGRSFQKPLPQKIADGSWLKMDISGSIVDYNEFDENPLAGTFGNDVMSVHDIIHKIHKAANDKKIKGIILEPNFISCGFANLHEIMNALKYFKSSGKEIIAYLDIGTNRDYFISTIADRIYLNPSASAGILLTGVGSGVLFYKDMLDKIGVKFEVIHAGKFKGAGETFSRNDFSEPVRNNLDNLFSDIYNSLLSEIAANRGMDFSEIKQIYEDREELFINQQTAIDYGLVDELIFQEDLYRKLNLNKNKIVSLSSYKTPRFKTSDNNIAIVYAQGGIVMQDSGMRSVGITAKNLNKILDKLEKDNTIKGVVIRVNSPGGSALVSEIIHKKIKKLRKVKPVVISMGNVAASGGYYISAESDYIFADPYTITGSIGVVAMFPNISKLTDKIGVDEQDISKGKFTNAFSIYSELDEAAINSMKRSIQNTYMEFKKRVADGRDISLAEVEDVAQGQVWSANAAIQRKLIDDIGMMEDAISKAAELSNTANFTVEYFPKKKNFLEEFIKDRFDVNIIQKIVNDQFKEDKVILNAWQLYKNIKNDPVQAIIPFAIENN